jgi:N6-adenosine-specific RNA methylase IME4
MPPELTIDPELSSLIPPLHPKEFEQLKENIIRDGCREPLSVWRSNGKLILLDGHNRLRICRERDVKFQVVEIDIASREHARLWLEICQAGRRNLTSSQKAMLWQSIAERRAALSKSERARRGGLTNGGGRRKKTVLPTILSKGRIRAAIAAESGLSERMLRAARKVRMKSPDLAARVRDGQMTLAVAHREIRRAEHRQKLCSAASLRVKRLAGLFDVIVIDPPWPMHYNIEEMTNFDYPTMSLAQIQSDVGTRLQRHAARDCHVFVWTTERFLPAAFGLLEAWKLEYQFTMVWIKNGGFQPRQYPQFNTEFVVYGRLGQPRFLTTKGFQTGFSAPRGGHSRKPEAFYAMIRRVTGGRRLDMFNRRPIAGFEGWGKGSQFGERVSPSLLESTLSDGQWRIHQTARGIT